ncbi:hypothetical protein Runsl_4557 [Runella slithyformis DSM 19594]|uniref:Uncharacterized protein n=2 Tax=Runella TaxID=105 RepID=A0A7U3ZPA0_RUNSL|nr:hypothetical protein Runsl_4557 [Runella slithyformis DSM 19594]
MGLKQPDKARTRITNTLTSNKIDQKMQKIHSEKMLSILGDLDLWIRVWKSGLGEVRVYVNIGQPFEKSTIEIACYYKTGNAKFAPGTMKESIWLYSKDDSTKNAFKELCNEIAEYWKSTKFSCQQSLRA